MIKTKVKLIKYVVIFVLIGAAAGGIWWYVSQGEEDVNLIDDTPLHIQSVKTIAELSTVSYLDEVVVDSVEYFKKDELNYYDPNDWEKVYDKTLNKNVKRRMTMIIKGQVTYGLDLTDGEFEVRQNKDTLWVTLPKPVILDIEVSPSKTEVFQELGRWRDRERKRMEMLARKKLKRNAEDLELGKKAEQNVEKLFQQLIKTEKETILKFK